MVEFTPTHFPGGRYNSDGKYPKASGLLNDCDSTVTAAEIVESSQNEILRTVTMERQNRSTIRFFPAAALYRSRGDAHVGFEEAGSDKGNRDCVHFCFAPGVLDALALATLGTLMAPVT